MANEIHTGDIGTTIILVVKDEDDEIVDISGATAMTIVITEPSGTRTEYTADFYTDGADGMMSYVTVEGDIDEAGLHRAQGIVELDGGTFYTSIVSFKVYCNL